MSNIFLRNYKTLVKGANFFYSRMAYFSGVLFVRAEASSGSSRSVILNVDLNNGCNLDCIMCATKHKKISEQQVFDSQLFDNKISPLFKYATDFQIGCFYEPLLATNFEEMVSSIARNTAPGIRGSLVSNGTLLNARKGAVILESGIFKRLRFSIDAASSQLYERIRSGARYSLFMKNINELVQQRNNMDRSVSVEFNFTIMPENIKQLPDLIKIAGNLGVDAVTTHKLHPNDMGPIDDEYYSLIAGYIGQAQEVADKNKVKFIAQNYYTKEMLRQETGQWKAQSAAKLCGFKDSPALLRIDPSANIYTSCLRVPVKISNMADIGADELFDIRGYRYLLKCFQKSSPICAKCYMYRGNHVPDIDWS